MTKTLTEQWENETLKSGFYWLKVDVGGGEYIDIVEYDEDYCDFIRYWDDCIKEVLAPVPSYQTWKEFQQHFVDSLELEVKLKKAYEELEKQSIEIVGLKTEKKRLVSNSDESKKKLAIATKALKEIAFEIGDLASDYGYHYELAEKALKEMEGVK